MKKERKEIIAGSVAALIIIAVIGFVSFGKFGTFNFVKAGIGFAQIQLTDTDYVEIQRSPKVVLTKNSDVFFDMLESEGYKHIEQNGSSHIIEKDGETELVLSHSNGYFTRWKWDE